MNEPFHSPMQDPRARDQGFPSASPDHYGRTQPFPGQSPRPYGQQPFSGPEPLAHEGGFAYGNPPAPLTSYGHPDQFVPAHLQVPHPYAQPMYQQPYMYPPQMPQQMQQTVFVNGGNGRRVNHVLHLVLTLLTAGLWLPVWIILAIANS